MCGMEYLSASLKNNSTRLRFLSLSGHRLTETDISGLAASPEDCQLEELCLTDCHLSDLSIAIFATMLPKMNFLKFAWLHDNPFGQVGASALLAFLERNWELEQLILPRGRGPAMDDLQRQIEFFLVLNLAGRRLLRATNNIPIQLALWPKVLDRADKAR